MRLIDADKLEDVNFSECMDSMEIMTVIDAQPTAYNVEKVEKQLEKELELADEEKRRCATENPLQFDSAKGYAAGISNALEIVRKGGKE